MLTDPETKQNKSEIKVRVIKQIRCSIREAFIRVQTRLCLQQILHLSALLPLIESGKHRLPASLHRGSCLVFVYSMLSYPLKLFRNCGCSYLTFFLSMYLLLVCLFFKLFAASHISRTFLGFCHLAEGLWRCLKCHIATPSSIAPSSYHSSTRHSSLGRLSLATRPLTSAGGCALIWSTVRSILKTHFSGGRDQRSPSIPFTVHSLCCFVLLLCSRFHCPESLCCI